MTDLSAARTADPTFASEPEPARNKVRFVTAASLFDGRDALISIMRRILQSMGCEVIHLGHNRSVDEVVSAALQEDVQGIVVSSYQGGHVEYFKYMTDALRARDGEHIQVFGGGGGMIVPAETHELQDYDVACIYSPEGGQRMGLADMIADMVQRCDIDLSIHVLATLDPVANSDRRAPAQLTTTLEPGRIDPSLREAVYATAAAMPTPVLGITGTGGAGKSSLTDELIRRFRLDQQDTSRIAVISIDPSWRKSGGALLGNRIRMNTINRPNIFVRSLATREASREVSDALPDVITACRAAGFDFIIVETSGIGQGDAAIVPRVDLSLYVMTPEFDAASQLEKIDMLDSADLMAINKFDRKGAQGAWRDVAKQVQCNREQWHARPEDMPVLGTQASYFNDDDVTALYHVLAGRLNERGMALAKRTLPRPAGKCSTSYDAIVPPARVCCLAELADTVRGYHRHVNAQSRLTRERQQLHASHRILEQTGAMAQTLFALDKQAAGRDAQLDAAERKLLAMWPDLRRAYSDDEYVVKIHDKEVRMQLTHTTLFGTTIRKVVLPPYEDDGEVLRWLTRENVPGSSPYTAGVFAFKRENEDPTRMFAGEGDTFCTNRRFKLVSEGMEAKRLFTTFDSVTLYGEDPALHPDIYGKIGDSGISTATPDNMEVLYDGFDLTSPATSVSMTINGPAPTILAMFMNTAVDQNLAWFRADNQREPTQDKEVRIRTWVLQNVRGTVQVDILKEDQGRNTCIFSTEFSLRVMGDIQGYFVHRQVRNFHLVSISGYHITEAGTSPVSQLAFMLANGFTYVEAYLARGMHIDDSVPNLLFFFFNGMDPECSVLSRVVRRIWTATLRDKYGASERSQKLKYHVQTSGRSLHAQEIAFNDIRTTLRALIAIYDNCNSLHTNAYNETITTPTTESVRRTLAIQLIINREWDLAKCENPNQGSFVIDELTDLVEEVVLRELKRIAERGGVLGAMETGYQRGRIQEESILYEQRKHNGSLPIIGVNTFRNLDASSVVPPHIELMRSSEGEKQSQPAWLQDLRVRHAGEAPAMLQRLQRAMIDDQSVFAVLMDAMRVCSLGQITHVLFEVGGQYRWNMQKFLVFGFWFLVFSFLLVVHPLFHPLSRLTHFLWQDKEK